MALKIIVDGKETGEIRSVGGRGPQGLPGSRGPRGLPGAAGPPNVGYVFDQPSAAALWVINHNLGFRPSLALFTTGGLAMSAEVLHTSINQVTVTFVLPTAGFARLT